MFVGTLSNKYPNSTSVEEALDKGLAAYSQAEENKTDILSVKEDLNECVKFANFSPIAHNPKLMNGFNGGGTIQYLSLTSPVNIFNIFIYISGQGTVEKGEYVIDDDSPIHFYYNAPIPCLINDKAVASVQITNNTVKLFVPETIESVTKITVNAIVYAQTNLNQTINK